MNELIQELSDKAKAAVPAGLVVDKWIQRYNEEYAKLIVQECVQALRDRTPVPDDTEPVEEYDRGYIRAFTDCQYTIEEHFGLE